MLALARVLAVPPKLLVVDELSSGLAQRVVDDVYRALREIHATRARPCSSSSSSCSSGPRDRGADSRPAQGPGGPLGPCG